MPSARANRRSSTGQRWVGNRSAEPTLDTDDANGRVGLLQDRRDTAGQPASADWEDDGSHLRDLLEELRPQGCLAQHDVGVVERVHERGVVGFRVLVSVLEAAVDRLVAQFELWRPPHGRR